jgi:hypothetical protein
MDMAAAFGAKNGDAEETNNREKGPDVVHEKQDEMKISGILSVGIFKTVEDCNES